MQTATSSAYRYDRGGRPGGVVLAGSESGPMQQARESLMLVEENERLRQSCAHLHTAAETWIRLYESALARANAAEQTVAQLSTRAR